MGNKTLSTRLYSARLTRQKPEFKMTPRIMQGCISGHSLTTFCIKAIDLVVQLGFLYQLFITIHPQISNYPLPNMWQINVKAYNSNHSRYCTSIFIRTIMFHNTVTTMLGLAKFLTIQERQRFESISTSWEFIPNTNPGIPREGSLRSPLVQLRSTFRGSVPRRIIQDTRYQDIQAQPPLRLSLIAPRKERTTERVLA